MKTKLIEFSLVVIVSLIVLSEVFQRGVLGTPEEMGWKLSFLLGGVGVAKFLLKKKEIKKPQRF